MLCFVFERSKSREAKKILNISLVFKLIASGHELLRFPFTKLSKPCQWVIQMNSSIINAAYLKQSVIQLPALETNVNTSLFIE